MIQQNTQVVGKSTAGENDVENYDLFDVPHNHRC